MGGLINKVLIKLGLRQHPCSCQERLEVLKSLSDVIWTPGNVVEIPACKLHDRIDNA